MENVMQAREALCCAFFFFCKLACYVLKANASNRQLRMGYLTVMTFPFLFPRVPAIISLLFHPCMKLQISEGGIWKRYFFFVSLSSRVTPSFAFLSFSRVL